MMNVNELPERWVWKKLGEVCEITTGKWDANHAVENGQYRFYTCAYDYLFCNTKRFNGECLILPGNGANVGEVFYYNGEFDAYQRTYVIQNIKSYPKYLYYHLKLNWRKGTDAKQYGSATNYIRIGNFHDYVLTLPPLPTQHAIVTKIEEIFSELDHGVEQLKAARTQLKVYRQAVLKWAFEGKLTNTGVVEGELPEGWKWVRLGEVADMCLGKMLDKQKNIGTLKPYLGNINVRWGKFNLDDLPQMRFEEKEDERYNLKKGDLVICEGGEPGRSAIWKEQVPEMKIQKALHRVRFDKNTSPEFFYYYLQMIAQAKKLDQYFTGTTIKHLTGQSLKKIEFPLPSIPEQHQIVSEIERRLSVCDKMEEVIGASLRQAEVVRQGVLKRAFEGRLV